MSAADGSDDIVTHAAYRYDVSYMLRWRPLTFGLSEADEMVGSSLSVVDIEEAATIVPALQKMLSASTRKKDNQSANSGAAASWRENAYSREKQDKNQRPIGVVTECVPVDSNVLQRKRTELREIEKATNAEIKEKAGLRNHTLIITGPPAIVEEALRQVDCLLDEQQAPPVVESRPAPPLEPVPMQQSVAATVEPVHCARQAPPSMAPPSAPSSMFAVNSAVTETQHDAEFSVPPDHPMYDGNEVYGAQGISHEYVEEQDWDIPDYWKPHGTEGDAPTREVVSPLQEHHADPMSLDQGGFWDDDDEEDGVVSSSILGSMSNAVPETVLPGRWRHAGRSIVDQIQHAPEPQAQDFANAPAQASQLPPPQITKAPPPSIGYPDTSASVTAKAPPRPIAQKAAPPALGMSCPSGAAPDKSPAMFKAPPGALAAGAPAERGPPATVKAAPAGFVPDRVNSSAPSAGQQAASAEDVAAYFAGSAEDVNDYFNDYQAYEEADEWLAEITGTATSSAQASTSVVASQTRAAQERPPSSAIAAQATTATITQPQPEAVVSSDGEAAAAGGETGKKKKAKKKKKKGEDSSQVEDSVVKAQPKPAAQNKFTSKTAFAGLEDSSESEAEAVPKVAQKPAKAKAAQAEKKQAPAKPASVTPSVSKVAAKAPPPSVVAKPPPPVVPAAQEVAQPKRSTPATVVKPPPSGVKAAPAPSVWNQPPSVSPAAATAVYEHANEAPVRKPPPPKRQDPPPVTVESTRGAPAGFTNVKAAPSGVKAKPAVKAKPKPLMPEPKAMNPLPQKTGPKLKASAMMNGGIPIAQDSSKAASGLMWAERPVEKIVPNQRYEEEEDPEMAQYIWDRKAQRPKNDARAVPKQNAGPPPSAFAGPPLSAGPTTRAQPPNAARQRALLQQVMEMGFDEPSSKRALASTGWAGVEQALGALLG